MQKENIQAIYPLSQNQLSFLIHHITAVEDQGLLQLSFDVEGRLDLEQLNLALNQTIMRHEALRATVHWEKIKKPVIVIHKEHEQSIEFIQIDGGKADLLEEIKQEQKQKGIDFKEKGLSRIVIYQLSPTEYTCVWICHHILLDGWSAVNLINELFERYENSIHNKHIEYQRIPSVATINAAINQIDELQGSSYWKDNFGDYVRPKSIPAKRQEKNFEKITTTISAEDLREIKLIGKQLKTTVSSLLQLAWGITLCKLYDTKDIVYGVTGSGRNLPLEGIEDVAYLLTNTLPLRFQHDDAHLSELIKKLDAQKVNNLKRENDHLSDIEKWIEWHENSPLIESVFTFANYPWKPVVSEDFTIKNLVGDYSSTHSLTLMLFEDSELTASLVHDTNMIPQESAEKLLAFFKNTAQMMCEPGFNVEQLLHGEQQFELLSENTLTRKNQDKKEYREPSNSTELFLNRIWQEVLGITAISTNQDFFRLGGTSVQALRICIAIEKETGNYFNPTALLLNPTIRELALVIDGTLKEGEKEDPTCLVPLKVTGTKPPLFCLHAGEGNVLFYREFAESIPRDFPVYAVQPQPLNADGLLPNTIEAMAKQYYAEIKKVVQSQPLFLLGTCLSNPICLEIAELALAEGKMLGAVFIIDSPPPEYVAKRSKNKGLTRLYTRIAWIIKEREFSAFKRVMRRFLNKTQPKKKMANGHVNKKEQLVTTLNGYIYKQHAFGIEFIRSSDWAGNRYDFHLEMWKEIVAKVDVSIVENSRHLYLFNLPMAKRLANVVASKLERKTKNIYENEKV